MNKIRVAGSVLAVFFLLAASSLVFSSANLQPLDSEDVAFGSCLMNLETLTCSPSDQLKTIRFRNVYTNPSVNEAVYKMGVFNEGYASKAFSVLNGSSGYSKDRIFHYEAYIPKNEEGFTQVQFSPKAESVQSCVDNRATECQLNSRIFVQPYYCNTDVTPRDCTVHDGLELHASGKAVFALPSISYSGTSLNFGQVQVGQTKTLTITISNSSSNQDFRFLVYDFAGDFGSDQTGQTLTVSASSSRTVNVSFAPTSVGTQSTTVYFSDQRTNIGKILGLGQAVNLSGEGVNPPPATSSSQAQAPATAPSVAQPTTPTSATPSTAAPSASVPSTVAPTQPTGGGQTATTEAPSTAQPSPTSTPTAPVSAPAPAPAPSPVWVAEGDDYAVTVSAPSISGELEEGQGFAIRGKAKPFAKIILYIRSDPVVVEVQADVNGDWVYAFPKGFDAGKHEIIAATVNNGGKELSEPVKIAEFEVIPQAQAADESKPAAEVGAETPITKESAWVFTVGLLLIVGLAAALVLMLVARRQLKSQNPSLPSEQVEVEK